MISLETQRFATEQAGLQTRRGFIKTLAVGAVLSAGSTRLCHAAFSGFAYKQLDLEHHHTGERLSIVYYEQGRYVHGALSEINYFLRDYHNNQTHSFDTALLDQLHDVKLLLGVKKPFHVVSGYRSPSTNENLRRHSAGVAKHSLHMEGRAVDIRIEGVGVKHIRDAALTLQRGGVGYYPSENFVHLDTGEQRLWRR